MFWSFALVICFVLLTVVGYVVWCCVDCFGFDFRVLGL